MMPSARQKALAVGVVLLLVVGLLTGLLAYRQVPLKVLPASKKSGAL